MEKANNFEIRIDYRKTIIVMLIAALLCLVVGAVLMIFAKEYFLSILFVIISVLLIISSIITSTKPIYIFRNDMIAINNFRDHIIKEYFYSDIMDIKSSMFGIIVIVEDKKIYLFLALKDFRKVDEAVKQSTYTGKRRIFK